MRISALTITKMIRPIAIVGGLIIATHQLLKIKSVKKLPGKNAVRIEQYVPDDLAYYRWMS